MTDRIVHPEQGPCRPVLRVGVCLIALSFAAQIYLIWSPTYPPLVDLPHHMARHYLEHLSLSGGELPPFYRMEYGLVPNLGGDLVVTPLLFFLGPFTACKVFLTLCVLLAWGGPALFILQQGGYRPPALAAALLFLPWSFGSAFFWGFLNYYSGVGLAFLVVCHYFHLHGQPRPRVGPLALHTLLVCLLFLWHLVPWGIYGVIVGCHLVGQGLTDYRTGGGIGTALRGVFVLGLSSLVSVFLFALVMARPSETALAGDFQWGGWLRKATVPLTYFAAYHSAVDAAVLLIWVMAVAAMFRLRPAQLRWSWLAGCLAAFLALYLLLPYKLGSTSSTDLRLLPAIVACFLALVGSLPLRRFALGAALLFVVLLLRFGSVGYAWHYLAGRLDSHARSFAHLTHRSRVMPIVLTPLAKEYPEANFLGWAVLAREVFVPNLLAIPGQQPLRLQQEHRIFLEKTGDRYEVDEDAVRRHYDYAWVYNPEDKRILIPKSWERIYEEGSLTLFRVN